MKQIIVLMSLALMPIGCSTVPEYQTPNTVEFISPEYQMGVGDRISVQVWKSPELSMEVPVRPDGKISVPLVGDITAQGATATELGAKLTKKFAGYVRNPQVTVMVLDPVSAEYLHRVRVTGAIKQPLSLNFKQGMTVLDLVLDAGGITEFANANQARLYRKFGDAVKVYPIRLDDILNKGSVDTNYQLAPSDIITIPERLF